MSRRTPALLRLAPLATLVACLACQDQAPTANDSSSPTPRLGIVGGGGNNMIDLTFEANGQPVQGVVTLFALTDCDDDDDDPLFGFCGPFETRGDRSTSDDFVEHTDANGSVSFDVPAGDYSFTFGQFDSEDAATAFGSFVSAAPAGGTTGFNPVMEDGNFAPLVCETRGNNIRVTVLTKDAFEDAVGNPCIVFSGTDGSVSERFNLRTLGGILRLTCTSTGGGDCDGSAAAIIETADHPWNEDYDPPLQPGTDSGVLIAYEAGAFDLDLTNLTPRARIALEGIFDGQTFSATTRAPRSGEIAEFAVTSNALACTSETEAEAQGDAATTDYLPDVDLIWRGTIDGDGLVTPFDGIALVYDQNPLADATETTSVHFRVKYGGTVNGQVDFTHNDEGVCAVVPGSYGGPLFAGDVLFTVACRVNDDETVHVTFELKNLDDLAEWDAVTEVDVSFQIADVPGGDRFTDPSRNNQLRSFATVFRAFDSDDCDLSASFGETRFSGVGG